MTTTSNMYASAKTWNPFKGCEFDCTARRVVFDEDDTYLGIAVVEAMVSCPT